MLLLTVRSMPAGGTLVLTCKPPRGRAGRRACPFKRVSLSYPKATKLVTLTKLFKKRRLPAGTTIGLRLTAPQTIGLDFFWTFRSGKRRIDVSRCLPPDTTKPATCPEQ